jgi:hypothetical protein
MIMFNLFFFLFFFEMGGRKLIFYYSADGLRVSDSEFSAVRPVE